MLCFEGHGVLSKGIALRARRRLAFRKNVFGINFRVQHRIGMSLHSLVTGPGPNMWYEFGQWAWLNASATPCKLQPPHHVSLRCMKLGTYMYHSKTHKKVSWTHRLNPTGSPPFWISWSFLTLRTSRILTNSSYRFHQTGFKIAGYHLDKSVIKSYQKILLQWNSMAVRWWQILMIRHETGNCYKFSKNDAIPTQTSHVS